MTTPATYQFLVSTPSHEDRSFCFYVPHEGHPEGAAYYFLLMQQMKNMTGGLPCRFLRANDFAEFYLWDEMLQDDAKYRYAIDNKHGLTVLHKSDDGAPWGLIYEGGTWFDFVNVCLKLQGGKVLHLFEMQTPRFTAAVMSLIEAKAAIHERPELANYARQQKNLTKEKLLIKDAVYLQQQVDAFLKA